MEMNNGAGQNGPGVYLFWMDYFIGEVRGNLSDGKTGRTAEALAEPGQAPGLFQLK